MPEFILDVDSEEWEKAGSKFITTDPSDKVGTLYYLDIEMGIYDWKQPGVSLDIPVKVTEEGPDLGKEDHIYCGVDKKALFKTKSIFEEALGYELKTKKGADKKDHVVLPDPLEIGGKAAVGVWQLQQDSRPAEEGGKGTKYPKLIDIYPAGYKPETEELT